MRIENFKELNNKALIGSFDLELSSGMTIIGMKLMSGKNGRWVAFPERPYQTGGETKYAKIIVIPDRDRSNEFNDLVLAALRSAGHFNG